MRRYLDHWNQGLAVYCSALYLVLLAALTVNPQLPVHPCYGLWMYMGSFLYSLTELRLGCPHEHHSYCGRPENISVKQETFMCYKVFAVFLITCSSFSWKITENDQKMKVGRQVAEALSRKIANALCLCASVVAAGTIPAGFV